MAAGNSATANGLNREGLKRHGFSEETRKALRQAYKIVYRQKLTVQVALEQLTELATQVPEVAQFCQFLRQSNRGIIR